MTKQLRRRIFGADERSAEDKSLSAKLGLVKSVIKSVTQKSANHSSLQSTDGLNDAIERAMTQSRLGASDDERNHTLGKTLSGFAGYETVYPYEDGKLPDWLMAEEPVSHQDDTAKFDPAVLFDLIGRMLEVVACIILAVIGWMAWDKIDPSEPARTANIPFLIALGVAGWAIYGVALFSARASGWLIRPEPGQEALEKTVAVQPLGLLARSVVLSLVPLVWATFPATSWLMVVWLTCVQVRHVLLSAFMNYGAEKDRQGDRMRQYLTVLGAGLGVACISLLIQGRQSALYHPIATEFQSAVSLSPIMTVMLVNIVLLSAVAFCGWLALKVLGWITDELSGYYASLTQERQFASVVSNLTQGIMLMGGNGKVIFANPVMRLITGIKDDTLAVGQLVRHIEIERIHPEDRKLVLSQIARLREEFDTPISTYFRMRHTDGNWRHIEAWAINLLSSTSVRAIVVSFADITQRKEIERLRLRERKLLKSVIDSLPDGVCIKDKAGIYQLANRAMALKLGLNSVDDLIGRKARDVFPKTLAAEIDKDDQQLLLTKRALIGKEISWDVEGVQRTFEITKLPLVDAEAIPEMQQPKGKTSVPAKVDANPRDGAILVILKETTQYKELKQQFEFHQNNDALTGLLNRRAFTEKLRVAMTEARAQNQTIAVMVLQIDLLKLINSRFGYDAGDHVLVVMVQRLSKLMTEGRLLARIGGAEFGILLHPLENEDIGKMFAARVQNEIRREVREESIWGASLDLPLEIEPEKVVAAAPELDVTVGITFLGDHAKPEDLLRDVYTKMLADKNA